jgi:hypothetical protein
VFEEAPIVNAARGQQPAVTESQPAVAGWLDLGNEGLFVQSSTIHMVGITKA